MNFAFNSLLGAPYRGGSLVMQGDTLLSPVGNRVAQVRGTGERERERACECGPPTAVLVKRRAGLDSGRLYAPPCPGVPGGHPDFHTLEEAHKSASRRAPRTPPGEGILAWSSQPAPSPSPSLSPLPLRSTSSPPPPPPSPSRPCTRCAHWPWTRPGAPWSPSTGRAGRSSSRWPRAPCWGTCPLVGPSRRRPSHPTVPSWRSRSAAWSRSGGRHPGRKRWRPLPYTARTARRREPLPAWPGRPMGCGWRRVQRTSPSGSGLWIPSQRGSLAAGAPPSSLPSSRGTRTTPWPCFGRAWRWTGAGRPARPRPRPRPRPPWAPTRPRPRPSCTLSPGTAPALPGHLPRRRAGRPRRRLACPAGKRRVKGTERARVHPPPPLPLLVPGRSPGASGAWRPSTSSTSEARA